MKKLFITALCVMALVALLIPGAAGAETLHSNFVVQNALVFYDTLPMRWVDVIGVDAIKYSQDFSSLPVDDTTGDPTEWTWTPTEVGAGFTVGIITTVAGGEFLVTTAANEDDGVNMQLKGESFKLEENMPLYFGCRLKISDATESDLFMGVGITDTDWLGGLTDGFYFEKLDGGTGMSAVTEDTAETQTDNVLVMDADYHIYEILYDGVFTAAATAGTIKFYIDSVLVATHTTAANITTDTEITPTIEYWAGAAGVDTVSVDWLRTIQLR